MRFDCSECGCRSRIVRIFFLVIVAALIAKLAQSIFAP
jgi:hypothetical protein